MCKNFNNFNDFKDFLKNKISWNGCLTVTQIAEMIKDKCKEELSLVIKINGNDINKFLKDIGFIEKDKNNKWITTPDGQKFSTSEKWIISNLMKSDKFLNKFDFIWIQCLIKNGAVVKFYLIKEIKNKKILDALKNSRKKESKDDLSIFIRDNLLIQDTKTKIISDDLYSIFISKYKKPINLENIKTLSEDEEYNILLTADFIFTFIDDSVGFSIEQTEFEKHSYSDDFFILTNDDVVFNFLKNSLKIKDDNLFKRDAKYKFVFNEKNFMLLCSSKLNDKLSIHMGAINEISNDEEDQTIYRSMFNLTSTDSNITKILIIQLLYKIYFIQHKIINTTLKNEFSTLDTEKILNIRKEILRYKALAGEIQSGREEAQKIYDLIEKRLLIKQKMDLAYKNLNEYFAIVNEETKIKEESEKEKRDKFNSKITRIAATITILTFISVIADIFNLFDRFFK
ncbi:hypothetical protein [Campylobacter ureolyticus]|uniref:Uncharacterized protein n=1 Tax=Campylobacter ureolyticus TaxID=827 RepID=A0A9Q4PRM7_9BACT|nr:hypothetical protein [Campylobacter ureolyticus]MCZ6159293.1 hypothetical protein [Campylobacter ureolyticus]MCZ6162690.1 hypothetical protein [Campylobacter ureolyticus]MCZ6164817.1 hypothetical protein [Campylobacter ureolyticus]MCZ6166615.1 hypothetical protein [Campylobacter ureolyticus]